MSTLLTLPKLHPEDPIKGEELIDGDYWIHKVAGPTAANHTYLWSLMRFRGSMTNNPYYLYPDGTVVREGVQWTNSVEYAIEFMGYSVKNKIADSVPRDRFLDMLGLAAMWVRGQGDYLMWFEPVEDPFAEMMEPL